MQSDINAGSRKSASVSGRMLFLASLVTLVLNFLPGQYSAIILYPVRLFVTLIHESGHAVCALLTGGEVQYLKIFANGEGVTWARTSPLLSWVYISGGYLGTAAFGTVLLIANRVAGWKTTLTIISLYVLTVTLLWAHNPVDNLFTLCTGVILAAIIFVASRKLNAQWAGFMVSFLAVQCCLNALSDIRILLYLTTQTTAENDAVFMSQQYPLPPTVWAMLWAVLSIAMMLPALSYYLKPARGSVPGAIK